MELARAGPNKRARLSLLLTRCFVGLTIPYDSRAGIGYQACSRLCREEPPIPTWLLDEILSELVAMLNVKVRPSMRGAHW